MIDMKNIMKAFTLGLTLGVLLTLALAYQNHKMNSILNTEDMNKKLRCLQAASRKSLVEETISANTLKKNEYVTK
jgi:hypothetical protein